MLVDLAVGMAMISLMLALVGVARWLWKAVTKDDVNDVW